MLGRGLRPRDAAAARAVRADGAVRTDSDAWGAVQSAVAAQIKSLVFKDGELNVAKEMKKEMRGTCLSIEEYNFSHVPLSDDWQCGSAQHGNFGDNAYTPSERVAQRLAEFAGFPLQSLAKLHLHSGNSSDSLRGMWCGMPAPPEYISKHDREVGIRQFWTDCVMRNAGYFNTLVCNTSGSYSVLGIAALNHGVCYPAHRHDNQEAYWQISGPGTWKTWPENFHTKPNEKPDSEIRITSPRGQWRLHNHPAGLIHEMDTTQDDDFLLAVYWWGKPKSVEVNYGYAHGVHEQGSCFADYKEECAFTDHRCPRKSRPDWAVD